LAVINPYAPQLNFPAHSLRARRDHKKYLMLIKAIAFLHQQQRPVKEHLHGDQVLRYIEVTREEWDRVMDVNLRAVFFVLQAVARRMLDQDLIPGSELRGKLIQTASIASYRGGNHLMTPYSASKAGVVSLTRSAAQALAPHRITSNCICPGAVETAMWEQIDREWGALEGLGQGEAWKRRIRGIPLGRPERPEDLAGVVAFLAGPDSDYMTGQALNVDGGLVMGN